MNRYEVLSTESCRSLMQNSTANHHETELDCQFNEFRQSNKNRFELLINQGNHHETNLQKLKIEEEIRIDYFDYVFEFVFRLRHYNN